MTWVESWDWVSVEWLQTNPIPSVKPLENDDYQ